jgi:hypothetical protein
VNHFLPVRQRALNHALSTSTAAYSSFLASDQFLQRTEFRGADRVQDSLAVLHHLLARLALDPRELARSQALMRDGVVLLHFFGVCNPVPMFNLAPASVEMNALAQAVEANSHGQHFHAAQRALWWRQSDRFNRRQRSEDAVVARLRGQMTWPSQEEALRDPEGTAVTRQLQFDQLSAKRLAVRERRNMRMAMLSEAAGLNFQGWTELLEEIAVNVFVPRLH